MVSLIRSGGHFSEFSRKDVVVKKGVRVTGLHVPGCGFESRCCVPIVELDFPGRIKILEIVNQWNQKRIKNFASTRLER